MSFSINKFMGFNSKVEARSYWVFLGINAVCFGIFTFNMCKNQSIFSAKEKAFSSGSSESVDSNKYQVELKFVD